MATFAQPQWMGETAAQSPKRHGEEEDGEEHRTKKLKTQVIKQALEDSKNTGKSLQESTMIFLLKMVNQHDQILRDLGGTTYTCVVIEDNEVVKGVLQATQAYYQLVQKEGKMHKRGPPFFGPGRP